MMLCVHQLHAKEEVQRRDVGSSSLWGQKGVYLQPPSMCVFSVNVHIPFILGKRA